jgi:cytochrome oxidase Cu insertion factor (SCO1/SenC/PrrC family)
VFLSVVLYMAVMLASACAKPPEPLRALPDFALTAVTVDGAAPLDRRALASRRVWVVDFVYTTCAGPCPMLSANMAELQKRLPASVGLLSFTVDPDHDSPRVLAAYARRFGADPRRWLFVDGDKPALMRLFRDGFLIPVAESAAAQPGQNVAHTTKFVLLDGQARVRGYYDGDDPASLDRLAADAARL